MAWGVRVIFLVRQFNVALTAATISSAILGAAPEMAGVSAPTVAQVVGNAVYAWAILPANLSLTGVTTGALGAGVVTGTLVVPPDVVVVAAGLTSAGVVGPTSVVLAKAVAVGLSLAFASAQYTGPSIGVAIGVDNSVVSTANPATLTPPLAAGFPGPSGPAVAVGLASGITSLLLLGTGIGVVAGTPTGGSGVGISGPSTVF